ncbi:MAG TPA: helix-turn-helix domain-containing protein [Solirubrobacterales bacterium]|nr:helix-turn-helix domain-containing protein [Solirubrobacterales bacterium]
MPEARAPASQTRPKPGHRKGDLREAEILDAAETLLGDPGYEGVTMALIASRTGITRPSLYFYFDSKQRVMTAVVERTLAPLATMPGWLTAPEADPATSIREGIELTAGLWREHTAVMSFAARSADAIPEVGRAWRATLAASRDALAELLERGGVEGTVEERRRMADALVAMVERSFWNLHAHRHTRAAEAELLDTLEELLVMPISGARG